jgi:hypothetical protein
MTITGVLIDQAMNAVDIQTAYRLTFSILEKTANLQTTPPTWATVLSTVTYSADLPQLYFARVVARSNYVYVYGYYTVATDMVNGVVFYSSDSGSTWGYTTIPAGLTYGADKFTVPPGPVAFNGAVMTPIGYNNEIHYVIVYDGTKQFPGGDDIFGYIQLPVVLPSSTTIDIEYDIFGDYPSVNYNTAGDNPPVIIDTAGTLTPITGGYHFSGHLNTNVRMAGDRSKIFSGWVYGDPPRWAAYSAAWRHSWITNLVVNGVVYDSKPPFSAIDCGRHTPTVVYVGSTTRIYKSIDGGQHFVEHITTDGAYDIECHIAQPTADAEITFINTAGELIRTIGGVVGGVYGGIIDVSPIAMHLRIASDPVNGFPLWVLEHQGGEVYKLRKSVDGAVWSDITINGSTSLMFARSLKEYAMAGTLQRRIVLLTSTGIWYSTDEATFTNKLAAFVGFSSPPVVVNLW